MSLQLFLNSAERPFLTGIDKEGDALVASLVREFCGR
jgi:hypothetical protein